VKPGVHLEHVDLKGTAIHVFGEAGAEETIIDGSLGVFDATGGRVAELHAPPGVREARWSGEDLAGRAVPPRIYFIRDGGGGD